MIFWICCLIVFLIMQGIFAGLETGIISVRRPRAEYNKSTGSKTAAKIVFFLDHPGLMISSALLGVNISVVCASIAAKRIAEYAGLKSPYALLAISCILAVTMLTFEIIPKNWFRQAPYERCSKFIYVLYGAYVSLYFPAKFFDYVTGLLNKLISKEPENGLQESRLRSDLQYYFMESELNGDIPKGAAIYLDNAAKLHAKTLEEIMIPVSEAICVSETATIREAVKICSAHNYMLLPFIDKNGEIIPKVFSSFKAFFDTPETEWGTSKATDASEQVIIFEHTVPVAEAIAKTRFSGAAIFYVRKNSRIIGIYTFISIASSIFEAENIH